MSGSSCKCRKGQRSCCACDAAGGDPGWIQVWAELRELHCEKADGYGTATDALANYTIASAVVEQADEFTCWLRILEKTVRALNLIRSGRADENHEAPDVAALAIGAEALRRRRCIDEHSA